MSDEGYQAFNDFYSHAREGRDGGRTLETRAMINFYSHAREGRDGGIFCAVEPFGEFLLTRPRGA